MKVLHRLTFKTPLFDDLHKRWPDTTFVRFETAEDVARECPDCDAIIMASSNYSDEVAATLKEHAKKLRWIQTSSDGVDKFLNQGMPENVVLTNAHGMKGRTIAEHAIGLLIALNQKIYEFERLRQTREWGRAKMGRRTGSIEGQTLVVVGYGMIGQEVARKAKAFDVNVIAVNRSGAGAGAADRIVAVEQLETVLPEADSVVLCLPITRQTRGLIGERAFGLMKPSSYLVNVARGEIVDTDALVRALENGTLAGAGLDVVDPEPPPPEHPLWNFENVILSPHVSGHGGSLYQRLGELFAENLERFREGQPLRNVINLEDHV